ncbi:MAG: [FeFe] hydrogenase, group A [Brevinema sp.]
MDTMVLTKMTINGKECEVPEGIPLIKAIEMQGIRVPRLCYHEDFYKNGFNGSGSCGLCIIKNNDTGKVIRSCLMKTKNGMNVSTNTPEVHSARRTAMQMILANHPLECLSCVRNQQCELQSLAAEMGIFENPYPNTPTQYAPERNSLAIQINPNKCIKCSRCVITCRMLQQVEALEMTDIGSDFHLQPLDGLKMNETPCISCGQCTAHCPVAGIYEVDNTQELKDYLANPEYHTVVQVAPAVRVSLGELFGMPAGTLVTGKVYTALRLLGFDKIFDTNFGADMTIMEEAAEFTNRFLTAPDTLPVITSCCPSWVEWAEKFFPTMIPHLSSSKSPHQMLGAMVKTYYAEKMNLDPKKIICVSIMPCTSKKKEIVRHPDMFVAGVPDVDLVITTRELGRVIKEAGIVFPELEDQPVDQLLGEYSGAGTIFGVTGGVMEAALRTSYYNITGENLAKEDIEFTQTRGLQGVKTAKIDIKGTTVNVAVAHGMINARKLLEEVQAVKDSGAPSPYDLIEIMACNGGCISGGGQPYAKSPEQIRLQRISGIYSDDKASVARSSHTNPMIIKLYDEYLEAPLSHRAHHLLHTHYDQKPIIRTQEELQNHLQSSLDK